MYLVSILVPIYKVEQYIERCAISLFEQTYSELEYIFIDDCSPDNSVSILENVVERYPIRKKKTTIIHHKKNRGLAAARNTALDHASGEFICVVDSDDWLEPNAVELLVRKQIETDADIVAGNAMMHTNDGDIPFYEKRYISKEECVLQQLEKSWDHTIWRRIIRRSLYEDHNIRCVEGLDMTEDRYQMAKLTYFAQSYAQIDDIIYHYEQRNTNSIMSQQNHDSVLRRDYQYLRNWMEIKVFFSDKEAIYKEASTGKALSYTKGFINEAVRYHDKKWFEKGIEVLEAEEATDGLKDRWLRNYYCRQIQFFFSRAFHHVKRRLTKS